MTGVLVAVSIPIFTAQLRKSRLATNQANARAAHAAVVAGTLAEGYDGGTGKYNVGTAMLSGSLTKVSGSVTATTPVITSWSVDTKINSTKLGDKTATDWTVSVDKNGNISYSATFPS